MLNKTIMIRKDLLYEKRRLFYRLGSRSKAVGWMHIWSKYHDGKIYTSSEAILDEESSGMSEEVKEEWLKFATEYAEHEIDSAISKQK